MKKTFSFLLLASALALCGCGAQGEKGEQGPQGEPGPQGQQGPQGLPGEGSKTIDFSKYEGKVFYYFDYEDEEYAGKIIRCGFDELEQKEYIVEGQSEHERLMGYDWFVPEIRISEGNIEWAWNSGYLTIPISEDPYQIVLNWGVEVYDNEFTEIQPGRYFDKDFYEIIFGDDVIIWYQELNDEYIFKLYYSEEFLKTKGVEFYDLDQVIDLSKLQER